MNIQVYLSKKHKKNRLGFLYIKPKKKRNHSRFLSVPRAGVEPARIAPLVFETSASTDSAIWAFEKCNTIQISSKATAKVLLFFYMTKFLFKKSA